MVRGPSIQTQLCGFAV